MTGSDKSERSLATKQLARTSLGRVASQMAKRLASQNIGGDGSGKWLMHGVIWQQCDECAAVCYPPRPLCPECLSEQLQWQQNTGGGRLLSTTRLHISLNKFYHLSGRGHEPWMIGLVAHDEGPVLFVFLDRSVLEIGSRIDFYTAPDITGESVIIGVGEGLFATKNAEAIAAALVHGNDKHSKNTAAN